MRSARAGFESDFERRGAGLGESGRAGLSPSEIGARRNGRGGDLKARGKGGRRRDEQDRLRRELAQRAAVVAMALPALRRGRGRLVVGLGAKDRAVPGRRLQRRRDARYVRSRNGMMIGQRYELREQGERGEQHREARKGARRRGARTAASLHRFPRRCRHPIIPSRLRHIVPRQLEANGDRLSIASAEGPDRCAHHPDPAPACERRRDSGMIAPAPHPRRHGVGEIGRDGS